MTPPRPPAARLRAWVEALRDPFLLLVGTSVLFHEVVIAQSPRELVLLLIAGCFGLPAMTGVDRLLVRRAETPPDLPAPEPEPSPSTGPPSSGAA